MRETDLATEVAAAVAVRWDGFARRRPVLARVIDQHLLVESAVRAIQADAEQARILANARASGASTETIVRLIDKFVVAWLAKLV